MAIREKTIEYAFPMTTGTVVDATVTNLTQITVEIPEASPTFISVFAEVSFQDIIDTTGGTITEHRVGLRLGAAGYTTITELDDISSTGEGLAAILGTYDFSSHFTTNWTGTSMTCDLQVYFSQSTGTPVGMTNVAAKLYITYSYDDTAATQIKTARIPLESLTGQLPTSATNFGTDQIPVLIGSGGELPENSPVIVDWFIQIEGNEGVNAGTTDWVMSANIDGGTATAFGLQESNLASDRFCRWIYKPASVPTTSTTHNLQLWVSTGAVARLNNPVVTLVVTYKFTLSGTTRVRCEKYLPVEAPSPIVDSTGDSLTIVRDFVVPETGTITLRQSAFQMHWNSNSGGDVNWRAGSQAMRTYSPLGNVVCGMFSLQQRIDSGSAQGAGVTIAAGSNEVLVAANNPSGVKTNLNGFVLINYEADVPSQGIGAASHTLYASIMQFDANAGSGGKVAAFAGLPIADSNYWLSSVGVTSTVLNSSSGNGFSYGAERMSGEGPGSGWLDIYADALQTDGELGNTIICASARSVFRRSPQDPNTSNMNIETARDFYFFSGAACRFGAYLVASIHHCTYTVAGSVTGRDPALPTELKLCREDGEVMAEQTLSAGTGSYSFVAYDKTLHYVDAYQDGTHVGRSALGTPA